MDTLALASLVLGRLVVSAPTSPYTLTVGALGKWDKPDDTSASSYIDKDGTYYFQQAHSLYLNTDSHKWSFYTGADMDSAQLANVSHAVNPQNPLDRNDDTIWRCNNSPTGKVSTRSPTNNRYTEANYCDLTGMWVDPDTGDWYGLVHNEFTPQPFADGLHYDGIDYAVSRDQGATWAIVDRIITSPYSTTRNDSSAFPQQTYYYGDGDPRLLADMSSGYFYVWYGSRVVDKGGSWVAFHEHVARAPMKDKFAKGSWQKYYDGKWDQPGLQGKESNLVPVSVDPKGYSPVDKEYKPTSPGKAAQQVSAGLMPPTSPLFVMDVSYNAYLGVWIGEPQAVDQSGKAPQEIYYTTNLNTQQWAKLGDTGGYGTASWYRWFLDPESRTQSAIVGKKFRGYCSFGCSGGKSSEYVNLEVGGPAASPVQEGKAYTLKAGGGFLSSSGTSTADKWTFKATGDGAYTISSAQGALGVDAGNLKNRAWGTAVAVKTATGGVGEQWWVVPNRNLDGSLSGTVRIVNRFSGLVLAVRNSKAETTPARAWDDLGSAVGAGRKTAEQEFTLQLV